MTSEKENLEAENSGSEAKEFTYGDTGKAVMMKKARILNSGEQNAQHDRISRTLKYKTWNIIINSRCEVILFPNSCLITMNLKMDIFLNHTL